MSEKINFLDLAALLSEKTGITKKEAEIFLREYFEVMNDALLKDKSLKIKDLGTFKLLLMDDRESVDVVSGERVLIPAHYKVTFSPDKNLAQAVNEPFSFFEPVEIDETAVVDEEEEIVEEEVREAEEAMPAKKKNKFTVISMITFLCIAAVSALLIYYQGKEPKQKQTATILIPVPEIEQPAQGIETDSLAVIDEPEIANPIITTNADPEKTVAEKQEKNESSVSEKRTLISGDRLTYIALAEYGNKIFWIYLYEENKEIIKNPDKILPGVTISIPPAQKYRIDKNSPESIRRAEELISLYKKP
ncbi:hypothetical protein FACS189426_19040 [Bacteroidia bacterium]|nr:hypothetical protein FACS189426_19040 [Bacteroidia bacterium]GHV70939.1 hypothetical protein FACS189420_4090 [Bacteroidia bacterium]